MHARYVHTAAALCPPSCAAAALQGRTTIQPHSLDAAPFTTVNTSTSGLLDDTIQIAVFRYRIWRSFWSNHVNINFPVYAVAILSLIVFWIPEDELAARVELCAALFLTLIGGCFS